MNYQLTEDILQYIESCKEETVTLLTTLASIPAPSGREEKRADFIKHWLENAGCKNVFIDQALNVIWPVNCENRDQITLFLAHTDVVFEDTEPFSVHNDGEYIHAPGIGDDTACLVNLMLAARFFAQNRKTPETGILFVANSCEEGLGNLKGIRQIMDTYSGCIARVFSFDSQYTHFINRCVGSHRYRITAKTAGGHSFSAFGNPNAIHILSDLVCRLYQCPVPVKANCKTTYNVGMIRGGTSVNTIAQSAELLYEYRSDDEECLAQMESFFLRTLADVQAKTHGQILTETVGIRPCGGRVDTHELESMSNLIQTICQKHSGLPCIAGSGSTDCNIPMSLGVPAVCVGSYLGSGAHTREEKVLLSSLPIGLKITCELIMRYWD